MRGVKAKAEVSVVFPTGSEAKAIVHALTPETVSRSSRVSVRVLRLRRVVKMTFYAEDLVALRAILNSFLRLVAVWMRVSEALGLERERAIPRRELRRSRED